MNFDEQRHLNEEALDEVLMGTGSPEAEVHVRQCDACREKLTAFRADVGILGKASLAWNEARSHSMLSVADVRRGGVPRPVGGWVAAGACLVLMVVGLAVREQREVARELSASRVSFADGEGSRESELREDNALMAAINAETAPIASPLANYDRSSAVAGVGGKKGEQAKP